MKLIVGLGNPGEEYSNNRHNVGFMMIDYIINQCQMSNVKCQIQTSNLKFGRKVLAEVIDIDSDKVKLKLVKPQLFMNQSGIVVKNVFSKFQILNSKFLYIIHDDLDLKLGEYKIHFAKGPKLHNGIESVEQKLQTKDFWRIRIGIDNRDLENRINGEKYVLQNFSNDEIELLQGSFRNIYFELQKNWQPSKSGTDHNS